MNHYIARFYFKDARSQEEIFCAVAQALEQWEPASGMFSNFGIDRESFGNRVVSLKGELTLEDLLHAVRGMNDPAYMLTADTTYRCWQKSEDGKGMEQRESLLGIHIRGEDSYDLRVNGQVEMVFYVRPYIKLDPRRDEVNQYVEKNLISMADFMISLAKRLDASSMKIYEEYMLNMPLNAHAAYYRDTQALQDDLRFIAEIWERGLPEHRLGAVKDGNPEDLKHVIDRRDAAWKDRMMNALNELLPIKAMPTAEDIRTVLHSRWHDYCNINEGYVVLDYPFYMNNMLDGFYIEVLKQAAGMKLDS